MLTKNKIRLSLAKGRQHRCPFWLSERGSCFWTCSVVLFQMPWTILSLFASISWSKEQEASKSRDVDHECCKKEFPENQLRQLPSPVCWSAGKGGGRGRGSHLLWEENHYRTQRPLLRKVDDMSACSTWQRKCRAALQQILRLPAFTSWPTERWSSRWAGPVTKFPSRTNSVTRLREDSVRTETSRRKRDGGRKRGNNYWEKKRNWEIERGFMERDENGSRSCCSWRNQAHEGRKWRRAKQKREENCMLPTGIKVWRFYSLSAHPSGFFVLRSCFSFLGLVIVSLKKKIIPLVVLKYMYL